MDTEKPLIVSAKSASLSSLRKKYKISGVIDTIDDLLEELFLIRNPKYKFIPDYKKDFSAFVRSYGERKEHLGNWVYFPWNRKLVRFLKDSEHQEVRTARNKNIIKAEEQKAFYAMKIGIAGLSVGSHAAATIAMMGGARVMHLADPDKLSASNLNRIRTDFTNVGRGKCDLASQQIYQIDPYAELKIFADGVTEKNIADFFGNKEKIDILVEETDNLEMKIRLRLKARELGVPVIMATDNGDNIIVEVERFDRDKKQKLFNGAIGDITLEEFKKFKPSDLPKLATKIAGAEFVTERMQESLLQVGKTLYSWPQLGDAATLSGVAVAYLVRRMALGEEIKAGKSEVNLDSIFLAEYHTKSAKKRRNDSRKKFLTSIGLS